ncbi:peptidase U32 family protein [Jeotgalibaca sp. A122]|uniref:peptidase U32 family protein n=1 Tax=Jeotgalibaca sp. A122 TaxID=3457322 RepID=UPI003FD17537
MIELIATTESLEQGKQVLLNGADYVVTGEEVFGLRLPGHLTDEEIGELVTFAHEQGKQVIVAANAILHNDKIELARPYLKRMKALNVDKLLVGDTGLIQIMKDPEYYIPYIYDASVLTTSSGQVNFWKKYGAVAALVAREVPYVELELLLPKAEIPVVTQIYGAQCIQQSKRNLLDNYFNFIEKEPLNFEDRHLFLSEPGKDDTHYSVYQDSHGTHVFATNDIHLLEQLPMLEGINAKQWYLDGLYTPGEDFVAVVKAYDQARQLLESGEWNEAQVSQLDERVKKHHPANRELDTGFFLYAADKVQ